MPRKRKAPDGGLIPLGKSRAEMLDRLYAPFKQLHGVELLRKLAQVDRLIEEHPDTAAARVIDEHLKSAHLHPALQGAPELSRFVFLMRELLHDHVPGMSLVQMLEPLETLLARRGGGRPRLHGAEWARLVEEKQRRNPRLTVDAACRQIAAEWRDDKSAPRAFATIQKAVRAERKSTGNPVSD